MVVHFQNLSKRTFAYHFQDLVTVSYVVVGDVCIGTLKIEWLLQILYLFQIYHYTMYVAKFGIHYSNFVVMMYLAKVWDLKMQV